MNLLQIKRKLLPICNINWIMGIYLGVLIVSSPLLFHDKEWMNLWLNSNHSPFLDFFFKYSTYLRDAWMFVPVFVFLFFRNRSMSWYFLAFVAMEAIIVQLLLKNGIYAHLTRPPLYIVNFDQLYQIPGVALNYKHTFPSGHTQAAFLMAFFLIYYFKNKRSIQVVVLVLAFIAGLSRVYLLQHFFIDIWFGSIIGFVFPYVFFQLQKSLTQKWIREFKYEKSC